MIADFGRTDDGRDVRIVSFGSDSLRCTALDLGCALRSVEFHGKDIVLGYDDANSYLHNGGHFGGVIGRYANRIRDGRCPVGDRVFQLTRNRGGHHRTWSPFQPSLVPFSSEPGPFSASFY